jgi:hypothetical protein
MALTWSPQTFTLGMLTSSTNTTILFPPAGPKVRPCRFSTEPSMLIWKILGVVRLLKVMVLLLIWSGFSLLRNWFTVAVLAVPGPPTWFQIELWRESLFDLRLVFERIICTEHLVCTKH